MSPPTLAQAQAAARQLCAQWDVELVLPGDLRREGAVAALAALHAVKGTVGWDYAVARERVSMALPGAGVGLDVLALVPVVGSVLVALLGGCRRPMVLLSPAAWEGEPVELLGTVQHELAHVGQVRQGGAFWCVGYGVLPELRGPGEGQCYVVDLAHRCLLGGESAGASSEAILAGLEAYGLGPRERATVRVQLAQATIALGLGSDPSGGTVADTLDALRAVGWVA